MDKNAPRDPASLLRAEPYPGRGMILGGSADGRYAVAAYFLTGRSANSRNRVLADLHGQLRTLPFDPSKVEDPSLIIYTAMRKNKGRLIVSNGDQTDTVYAGLKRGLSFEEALLSRAYEPDAPHYTPRVSALLDLRDFSYKMSILRRTGEDGACERVFFDYPLEKGIGRYLSTYRGVGDPLPSFYGDPVRVALGCAKELPALLWDALNRDNRIALCVKTVEIPSGRVQTTVINRNTPAPNGADARKGA